MSDITDQDFDEFLDRISVAFIRPDFALWRDSIVLPFSLVTKDGPVTLRSVEELEDNFNQYLLAVAAMGLDRVYRIPISLENCHDGTWIGTYQTNLMTGHKHATDPYTSSALLIKTGTGLKMLSVLNARGHHDWVGEHPAQATYGTDPLD